MQLILRTAFPKFRHYIRLQRGYSSLFGLKPTLTPKPYGRHWSRAFMPFHKSLDALYVYPYYYICKTVQIYYNSIRRRACALSFSFIRYYGGSYL